MVEGTSVASLHARHYNLCILTYEYINKLSPLDRTKFEQIDRVVSRTFATDVQR
jgi:hypothetical protein